MSRPAPRSKCKAGARTNSRTRTSAKARKRVKRRPLSMLVARLFAGLARFLNGLADSPAPNRAGGAASGGSRGGGRVPRQGSGRPPAHGRAGAADGGGFVPRPRPGGLPPVPPGWEPDRPAWHRRRFPTLSPEQRQALWARENGYDPGLVDDAPSIDSSAGDHATWDDRRGPSTTAPSRQPTPAGTTSTEASR